jgi:hypothetical protein
MPLPPIWAGRLPISNFFLPICQFEHYNLTVLGQKKPPTPTKMKAAQLNLILTPITALAVKMSS